MRKPPKSTTEPPAPDWFVERKYTELKTLDAWGWHRLLKRIWKLSEEYKLGLAEGLDERALRCDLFAPQTVELIGPQQSGYVLESHRLPALIVYVNAPDAVILSEIKRTLKTIPKQLRPPTRQARSSCVQYSIRRAHIRKVAEREDRPVGPVARVARQAQ